MADQDKKNTVILIVIALLLVGILGLLLFEETQKTPEEKIADSVSETLDQIGDAVSKKGE